MNHSINRESLRAHVPERYLSGGFRGDDGRPFKELSGWWATAAAEQLLAGRVALQELETTFESLLQVLPYYEGRLAGGGIEAAGYECLDLVANLLDQPNNPALVAWLEPCLLKVATWEDAKALMVHVHAVVLQYAALSRDAPES